MTKRPSAWSRFVVVSNFPVTVETVERLSDAYRAESWKWKLRGGRAYIPFPIHIKKAAYRLSEDLPVGGVSRTGGLLVERSSEIEFKLYAVAQLAQHLQPQKMAAYGAPLQGKK